MLSPKTVRNHVSNVMTKIHAIDRPHAIVLSRRMGLGEHARPRDRPMTGQLIGPICIADR